MNIFRYLVKISSAEGEDTLLPSRKRWKDVMLPTAGQFSEQDNPVMKN